MSDIKQLKGYTVYQDPGVDEAITEMIKGGEPIIIGLVFDGNKFQMKNINNYLASKIQEVVGKRLSEQ